MVGRHLQSRFNSIIDPLSEVIDELIVWSLVIWLLENITPYRLGITSAYVNRTRQEGTKRAPPSRDVALGQYSGSIRWSCVRGRGVNKEW